MVGVPAFPDVDGLTCGAGRSCGASALCPRPTAGFHCVAKKQVSLRLVTSTITFQPVDDILVEPNGYGGLCGTVETANLRTAPISILGHLGEINRSVGLGGDGGDVPFARGCEHLHTTSFP